MSVSQKWSGVFKQCQMLQFYVTIVNMFWHTLGMHDWVMRDDMGPLAFMWDEVHADPPSPSRVWMP